MTYLEIKSGGGTYYYYGSSPANAYSGFQRDTGRSGSYNIVDYNTFANGLRRFGYNPPPPQPGDVPAPAPAPPPAPAGPPPKTADQIAQEAAEKAMAEYKAKAEKFDTTNPFAFDEELAKRAAQEDVEPYYKQKLADFLRGIETTRQRSVEDERNILEELKANTQSYTGRAKMDLDKAINAAKEGAAEAGMYFSGQRERQEGIITEESQYNVGEFMRGAGYKQKAAELAGTRTRQDLSYQQELQTREIERAKGLDIAEGVKEAEQRAAKQRELERTQYLGQAPGETFVTYDKRLQDILRGLV